MTPTPTPSAPGSALERVAQPGQLHLAIQPTEVNATQWPPHGAAGGDDGGGEEGAALCVELARDGEEEDEGQGVRREEGRRGS